MRWFLLVIALPLSAQTPAPVIDMHLHANTADSNGPPPLAVCPGEGGWPAWDQSKPWVIAFTESNKKPLCKNPVWSPETDDNLMKESIAVLKRRNVIGVTSGSELAKWLPAGGDRIIPAMRFGARTASRITPDQMRQQFKEGRYRVFAEVAIQYDGLPPNDPLLEPYVAVAEELDIPMGIHIGTGPPGAPYFPPYANYRARLHSALLLEEVLIKHPKLRVYVMHAGWPLLDDMLAVMWAHPQVHVDTGAICWALPQKEFHRYLQRIVEAGFGKRVMFGSDQMNWPGVIESCIDTIEAAPFLSAEQKRDILYNNAARFLRLNQ